MEYNILNKYPSKIKKKLLSTWLSVGISNAILSESILVNLTLLPFIRFFNCSSMIHGLVDD